MLSQDKDFTQAMTWIEQQATEMESLLTEWSLINTGTSNLTGLSQQLAAIETQFHSLNATMQRIKLDRIPTLNHQGEPISQQLGDILLVRQRPLATKRFLLCGHMDTVFPSDSPFQRPVTKQPGILVGPGVTDMKGGLVVLLFALRAIEQTPWAKDMGWDVLINSDEEIGSPGSAPYLASYAKESQVGLVFESALDEQGTFASSRKGSGKFTIVVHGRSAHAGRNYHEGRNAIYGLAQILIEVNKLNGRRDGVTINAGIIEGGNALNVVPALAVCRLDLRILEASDAVWAHTEIQKILDKFNLQEGFNAELQGGFGRKPKPFEGATEKLFTALEKAGAELGLPIHHSPSGGCCDGNNLAAAGLPTIDTLGVRGGSIHTYNEYIILDSIVERAKLTATLILTLVNDSSFW